MREQRKQTAMAETCSVFRCGAAKDGDTSVHVLPKDPTTREKWISFIWNNRSVPEKIPPKTRICSNHFQDSCFENLNQKRMGFATKLILKHDAVPSVCPGVTASESKYVVASRTRNASCQTDAVVTNAVAIQCGDLSKRTVGTQLSEGTLTYRRSHGAALLHSFEQQYDAGRDLSETPELTEQHRIRLKEEELSGVESVHMAESETVCASAHNGELRFCAPSSSSMMQAGVRLRQDTETTLPELTEQHRLRLKEEELNGLESVHMAESETECAAPGLNTLEPECVTAHCRVSDVHHTHTPLIKTEADLGSIHSGDHIKTESLDSTELGYVSDLHPDQIKTEADDGKYLKIEHTSAFQDVKYANIKSDEMKCESSEISVHEMLNTAINGTCFDHINETESCSGEPNWKPEGICDLPTEYDNLSLQHSMNKARTLQKNANGSSKHINCQRMKAETEPLIINPQKTIHTIMYELGAGVKPFECMLCEESSPQSTDLNTHLRVHRVEKPYKCSPCGKCFARKADLNNHLRIHTGEKPYKCTQCKKCFDCKSHLNAHRRVHRVEKPYKCTPCGKCFARKANLNNHLRIHTGEKPYKCSHCGKCFSQRSNFVCHLKIHTGEKPFKCTYCEKCFQTKPILNTHLRIHTGEKPYKCSHCGKCFSQRANFVCHLKIHSGEKPYKCTHCEKCFHTKSFLNTHLRIHTGEKPYKCTHCEKCFHTKPILKTHLRIHTGEKPFQCSFCGKCFSQRAHLDGHLRIHTGEKPYKCTQCEKCFHSKCGLTKHLFIHTGEKPYKCSHCGKCFSQRTNLVRHLKIHTDGKPFKCTV